MTKVEFLLLVIIAMSSAIACNQKEDLPEKPNILFLLADDMGYGELGSFGQEVIKTPYLDKLAGKSMRFTDFYSGTSVCSPSRASLMTGMHTGHTNIRGNNGVVDTERWGRIPLKKSEVTIGEMLQGAGYQTAFIGKWHLGLPEDTSTWAMSRGFEYAVQEQWGTSAQGETFDERMHWINNRMDSAFYDYKKHDCIDEFRTNFALNYLSEKDENKPFFLFMSYRIPHAHEFFLRDTVMYADKGWPEIERRHAARITMFDQQIKRLMNKLEEMGELENTLVIYSSDNGPHNEGPKESKHDRFFFKSSGGLKGFKRDLYEGGIRVPTFAYWQDKIEEGKVTKQTAAFYDIMPTLAEVAGITPPKRTDGISFLPTLLGKEQPQHDHFYWEIQEGRTAKAFKQAARKGKWKAVRYGDNYKTELYDLSIDKFEGNDLSAEHPEIVAEMNEIMKTESVKNPHWPYSGGIFK